MVALCVEVVVGSFFLLLCLLVDFLELFPASFCLLVHWAISFGKLFKRLLDSGTVHVGMLGVQQLASKQLLEWSCSKVEICRVLQMADDSPPHEEYDLHAFLRCSALVVKKAHCC